MRGGVCKIARAPSARSIPFGDSCDVGLVTSAVAKKENEENARERRSRGDAGKIRKREDMGIGMASFGGTECLLTRQ